MLLMQIAHLYSYAKFENSTGRWRRCLAVTEI